jgi:hypothetical protein
LWERVRDVDDGLDWANEEFSELYDLRELYTLDYKEEDFDRNVEKIFVNQQDHWRVLWSFKKPVLKGRLEHMPLVKAVESRFWEERWMDLI